MIKTTIATPTSVMPESFQGWSKLEPQLQERARVESAALEEALQAEVDSHVAQGEHLNNLREIWKGMFLAYLKQVFKMSRATAYRRMGAYEAVQKKTSPLVLEMAIERGTKITPQILEKNPPPKTEDRSKIVQYLDTIRPQRVRVEKSPEDLLKECINFVGTRWDQLPRSPRVRTAFKDSLVGMLLAKFGVASPQTFSPMAQPESFRVARGRPPKKAIAA